MKKSKRERVYARFGGHCSYCGNPLPMSAMQIDHMVPKSDFRGHRNRGKIPPHLDHIDHPEHPDNLYPSCGVCNKWKSAHHLELFRLEIQEQIKRLNDYSANFRMAKRYGLIKETPKPVVFHFELVGELKTMER